jgi:hypothetical protein
MKTIVLLVCLLTGVMGFSQPVDAGFAQWQNEFHQALVAGKGKNLERFFTPAAYEREAEGWKYNLENGFLIFSGTEIVLLSDKAILLHIPTSDQPYSGEHEDSYFDFIYRIYEIQRRGGSFLISRRSEEEFNPDFIQIRSRIEIRPAEQLCLVDSMVSADLPSNHLIFKLAKEFEIEAFTIKGKKVPYKRLGYFVHASVERGRRIVFSLKGKLPVPLDNNQFFSMDKDCFFLRIGGFAALPSPPPGANGRYFFSTDKTKFDLTYVFPKEFKFLQYGKISRERISGDKKTVSASSAGEWMDNIAFYAQKDWVLKSIRTGNARLSLYFSKKDWKVLEPMTHAIQELFDWVFSVFHDYPEPEINFIVLDRFVKNGALNDSRSIITQDAQTQVDDTYIHEILHTVPKPSLKEDYLWVKEGFTNFLSFDFIDFRSDKKEFWKKQQRRFLHCFDQFSEPLAALTSTRMPTYWAAYQKGPWVYRMLSAVIGEFNFQKALLEFAKMKGRVLAGPREYFRIFEKISGEDLAWFEEQWLKRKENPVLRIESSSEALPNGAQLKIKILQEGKIFRLPLDVEIRAGDLCIRKTLWIDAAEKEFAFPVDQSPVSVQYDPDAKLFAILKTGKISFLDQEKIVLPQKTIAYHFKSDQTGKEFEFQIMREKEKVIAVRKEEGKESVLELSPSLSPLKYSVNGATIYSLDPVMGKIVFADDAYDIAEPVYPEEFIVLLFACADWSKSPGESLLFLRPNTKWCAGAYAECERISDDKVKLKIDFYTGAMEMSIRDGVPLEYTIDGKERYVLQK